MKAQLERIAMLELELAKAKDKIDQLSRIATEPTKPQGARCPECGGKLHTPCHGLRKKVQFPTPVDPNRR